MMKALGATGVELPYNDIYPKLQTGDIDGAQNSLPSYLTGKQYETEAAKRQRELWAEFDATVIKELESKGVKVIRPNKEVLRKEMEPLYGRYSQQKDLIKEIQAVN